LHQIFITMTIKSLINLILTTKALLSFMVMYPTNRLRTVINYLLFVGLGICTRNQSNSGTSGADNNFHSINSFIIQQYFGKFLLLRKQKIGTLFLPLLISYINVGTLQLSKCFQKFIVATKAVGRSFEWLKCNIIILPSLIKLRCYWIFPMVMYPTNRLRTVINYLLFVVIRNIYQKSEHPWDTLSW